MCIIQKGEFYEKTKNFGISAARHDGESQGYRGNVWYFRESFDLLETKKQKKSIIVVGRDMLNAVQELKKLVQSLIQGKPIDDDVADSFIRYSHFLEKFVALDNANEEIIVGGGRRGN